MDYPGFEQSWILEVTDGVILKSITKVFPKFFVLKAFVVDA